MLNDESIMSIFDDLKDAIKQKNMEKILKFYNENDKQFLEKIETSYLQWINNDDAQYNHEILEINKSGEDYSVIITQVIEYQKDKLEHHNPSWSEVHLSEINGDLKIIKEAIYNIGKNIETNLQVYLDVKENKLKVFAYLLFDLTVNNLDKLYIKLNRGLTSTEIYDYNDNSIMFLRKGDSIELKTNDVLIEEKRVAMKIQYDGIPYNSTGKFGYKIVYIGEEGSYASFISNWYPQIAFSKTTGRVYFNAPEDFTITCTGKEIEKYYLEDRIHYVFKINVLQIYAFAAANYFSYNEEIDGIRYGAYILKERKEPDKFILNGGEEKAKLYLRKAIEIISFLKSEIFGTYPYENYSIVEVPAEIAGRTGGMSEQGMNFYPDNSLNEYYVNTPIFAHEIGHLWWGNWVIGGLVFLSEGLANIGYALSMEKLYGEEIMRKFLKYGAIDYFQGAYYYFATIAERDEDMKIGINNWEKAMKLHTLSNTKGFIALLMLRDIIGKETFYQGFQTTIKKYAHTYMTLDELRGEFEKSSNTDLKWFFDQWFFRTGAPEFDLKYDVKESGKNQFEIKGSINQLRELYQVKIELLIANNKQKITEEIQVKDKITNFSFKTKFKPTSVVLDPNYKVFRWTQEFNELSKFGDSLIAYWTDKNKCNELMKEFLEEQPDSILGHCWSGVNNFRFYKDNKQAITHFRYVIDNVDPFGPYEIYYCNALYYLGLIYQEEGEKEKAIEVYESLVKKDRTKRYHLIAKKKIEKLKEK